MSENTKTFDAIIILTGEPKEGNAKKGQENFPVSKKAIEEYKKGFYDCIFVSGGYNAFVNKMDGPIYRKREELGKYADVLEEKGFLEEKIVEDGENLFRRKSDAEITANFLKEMGIPEGKVNFDSRAYEDIGKFTFPLVHPIITNPSFEEFSSMLIFGQEGQMWKTRNYAKLVFKDTKRLDFFTVPSKKNIHLADITYYTLLRGALSKYHEPEEIHSFLLDALPIYNERWFDKSKLTRAFEMGLNILDWIRPKIPG